MNQLPRYEGWASRTLDRAPDKLATIVSNYQVGQIVTEPGFTSASKTLRLAGNLKFYIFSKNFRVLDGLSFNPTEQEVTTIPGTAFKVVGKSQDAEGTWHIKMIDVTGR